MLPAPTSAVLVLANVCPVFRQNTSVMTLALSRTSGPQTSTSPSAFQPSS